MKTLDTKTAPELSVDSQMVYKRLKRAQLGEIVTYEEIKDIIGRNPQAEGYGTVVTARRNALKYDQMLFECVPGKGIKRMENAAIVSVGHHAVQKINRAAKNGLKRMSCADYPKLPQKEKIRFNVHASLLGALRMVTSEESLKMISDKVATMKEPLPAAGTLALFHG